MRLKQLATFLIILMIISCKKPATKHVLAYDGWNREVEMLNGPVKEIYQGDSTKAGTFFRRIDFDKNGKMVRREKTDFTWSERNGLKDSVFIISKITYRPVVSKEGRTIAVVGEHQTVDIHKRAKDTSFYKSKWGLDGNGKLTTYFPNAENSVTGGQYYYDKNGDMIRYTKTSNNNCCGEITVFKYDHLHRIVEIDWGKDMENGSNEPDIVLKTTSRYLKTDSEGNWIVAADYNQNLINRKDAPHTDTVTRKITYYK